MFPNPVTPTVHIPRSDTRLHRLLGGMSFFAGPLHKLASRRISENFPEMNAMESHASECLSVLHNQIEDVAAVVTKCGMHEIYIRGKSFMPGSGVA